MYQTVSKINNETTQILSVFCDTKFMYMKYIKNKILAIVWEYLIGVCDDLIKDFETKKNNRFIDFPDNNDEGSKPIYPIDEESKNGNKSGGRKTTTKKQKKKVTTPKSRKKQ